MTALPKPLDPLGEALHFLRMSGVFYCRSEFTAPWALALPAFENCVMFHMVTAGECWVEVEGADTYLLRAGELTALRLVTLHNLSFIARLMEDLRGAIEEGRLAEAAEQLLAGGAVGA